MVDQLIVLIVTKEASKKKQVEYDSSYTLKESKYFNQPNWSHMLKIVTLLIMLGNQQKDMHCPGQRLV